MTPWQAIVLGIVQGLTEFLPISSTAHLRIVPALLGWSDPGAAFTAVIQIGTLLAVLVYFRADIWRIGHATLFGMMRGQPLVSPDARLGWMIVLGTVPIVVCGLAFQAYIKSTWRDLYVVSGSLIVLAIVLAVAEAWVRRRGKLGHAAREVAEVNFADAAALGLAQAVALIPGASRSGVTISAGLFRGLSREAAAKFSFLLSLPAVLAAGVHELYDERSALLATDADLINLLAATLASAIVGYASIAFLLGYLRKHSTWLFIVYRLALGGLLLALLASGALSPDAGL